MRWFFICCAVVLLVSCQKTSPITQTPPPETNAIKNLIPGEPTSSGKFKLTFASVSPAPTSLPDTIPSGSALLQFTLYGFTYQFNDSIATQGFVGQDGLTNIQIAAEKYFDGTTGLYDYIFRIYITGGDSTQITPGRYQAPSFGTGLEAPHSAIFEQQEDGSLDSVIDVDWSFSLDVLSYVDGYLSATFHSSRITNGIINHLLIKQ